MVKPKKLVFGKGTNDLSSTALSYPFWHSMIRRAYSEGYHKDKPSYRNVEVCDDWLYLSNFNCWFNENYVEEFQLDKDLLNPGCKLYSPENCCFLPNEINSALHFNKNKDLPPGVSYKSKNRKYVSQMSVNTCSGRVSRHIMISDDPMECFIAYKIAKENYLKELAEKWKNLISDRAYSALVNYNIELSST